MKRKPFGYSGQPPSDRWVLLLSGGRWLPSKAPTESAPKIVRACARVRIRSSRRRATRSSTSRAKASNDPPPDLCGAQFARARGGAKRRRTLHEDQRVLGSSPGRLTRAWGPPGAGSEPTTGYCLVPGEFGGDSSGGRLSAPGGSLGEGAKRPRERSALCGGRGGAPAISARAAGLSARAAGAL